MRPGGRTGGRLARHGSGARARSLRLSLLRNAADALTVAAEIVVVFL